MMSTRTRRGTPQRWWRDNPAPTLSHSPKQVTMTRNSTHGGDRTTQPAPPCLRAGALRSTCSWQWHYRHQRTWPTPAPCHHHPICAATHMKAPTVQRWSIAQCPECRGYQGCNKSIWVYGFGALVMRWLRYMFTAVFFGNTWVWCSHMSAVYAGVPVFYWQTWLKRNFQRVNDLDRRPTIPRRLVKY